MRQILKRIGIDSSLTTAYHPQANGQTEHENQEVEQYLCLYISHVQDDWSTLLLMADFVMNACHSSASDHTLFKLIYGYTPNFMIPPSRLVRMPHVNKHLRALEKACKRSTSCSKDEQGSNEIRSHHTAEKTL